MPSLPMHPSPGCRVLRVTDPPTGRSFPVVVMYPSSAPAAPAQLGPYTMDLAPDAPLAEGTFPIVLVSHGSGGSPLAYRTLAGRLARHGYVVALPEHPGNNRDDNSLDGADENLAGRPRHLSLALDDLASDRRFAGRLEEDRVAIVGHSMGGYTALAAAGGHPRSQHGPIGVSSDPRVRALVLMAPATPWYMADGSLRQVTVPILLLLAEHDPYTPRWHGDLVLDRVPDRSRVNVRVVENAGHFSFLSPYPPSMRRPGFLPAVDPEGFDRERFQDRLATEVVEFLGSSLRAG
jgi:predicted dienelactone hydrolase